MPVIEPDMISLLRRDRAACLYCDSHDVTREHPIPVALGGRLCSKMLCERHREAITAVADEPAIENLKPLTFFCGVRRQDGKVGASFRATTDDGTTVSVTADGQVPKEPLAVQERDTSGRIARATGRLENLDRLQAQGAFSTSGTKHVFATTEKAPVVNFAILADEAIASFILKIAFHHIAGFVDDPDPAVADAIFPFIIGEQQAAFNYVSTPITDGSLFPDSWPPRHEVTVYPRGNGAFVTVLLFNAYGYLVKLPIPLGDRAPLRYTQPLLGRPDPQLYEVESVPNIQWEYKTSQEDMDRWADEVHRRLNRIQRHAQRRILRRQCFGAAKAASAEAIRTDAIGDFWYYYRARLQLEAFDAQLVERLVNCGRQLRADGKKVWEI